MIKLLHTELLKLKTYPLFWVSTVLFAGFIPLLFAFFLRADFQINDQDMDLFQFLAPNASSLWQYLMFVASYGVYILVLFLLSYTNRDLTNGIWRQYIIEGVSRNQLVSGRIIIAGAVALLAMFLLFVMGVYTIAQKEYSGIVVSLWELRTFFACFGLYLFSFMMMALVLNTIVNSTILSFLGIFFWSLFVEGVVRWIDPSTLSHYLPVYNFNRLIPNQVSAFIGGESLSATPEIRHVIISVVWTAAFIAFLYGIDRRRDF